MPVDEDVVENLQKLLDKVEQMKQQRAKLLDDFRLKVCTDYSVKRERNGSVALSAAFSLQFVSGRAQLCLETTFKTY